MWNIFIKFFPIFFLGTKIEAPTRNTIKGAVFDFDGTLIDTEPIYDKIHQDLVIKYGNGKKYGGEIRKYIAGATKLKACKALVEGYDIKLSPEEIASIRDEISKTAFANCSFMPGARELTHKLKHEFNIKTAVATSSSKNSVEIKTNHIKDWLKEDIDKLICGDDKRIKNGKPNPDIFLLAIKELGLNVEECIIFEDAINGIKAAINTGVPFVIAIPKPDLRKEVEEIKYDKNKTKLIILDSLKDFDFTLIK